MNNSGISSPRTCDYLYRLNPFIANPIKTHPLATQHNIDKINSITTPQKISQSIAFCNPK